MSSIDVKQLRRVANAGLQLIPLHRWDSKSTDAKGRKRDDGKRPKDNDWPRRDYSNDKVLARAERDGINLGIRPTAEYLVVDVDPRNFPEGRNPLAELSARIGVDLSDWTPRTVTGGGGLHLWMTKPADVSVVDGLPDFPGVEFKTRGRQVVAPGSVHPETQRLYTLVDPLEDLAAPDAAPAALLDMVARTARRYDAGDDLGDAQLAPSEVATVLTATGEITDYNDWVRMLMACHAVSGGLALAECQEWSYDGDADEVAFKWAGFDATGKGAGRVGWGTLRALAEKYGGAEAAAECDRIWRGNPADDFADAPELQSEPEGKKAASAAKADANAPLSDGTPMTVAAAMLKGQPFIRCNGDWLRYDKAHNCFREVPEESFQARAWRWMNGRAYRTPDGVKHIVASNDVASNVKSAAIAQRQGPRDLPAWHPRRPEDPAPSDLLAVRNGLLHLPTMDLLAPTPRLVNRNTSPVDFDPLAEEPSRWLSFLAEVFAGDDESAATLQEVMGYLLTQDTSQQKVFCLVGPPRSGKGTVNRVIQLLVGEGNYTSPTANSLSRGEFGLAPLIGRQLATISDMRMGKNADPASLAENLLRVSGEDEVSVNRKYKDAWEGRLSTRFLLVSNELPQFRDTSGAIVSRMVLMRTTTGFIGSEDPGLTAKLRAELPGVLNWALAGLRRLRARGHFVQPASARAELAALGAIASPVKAFATERLRQDADAVTDKDAIWLAFNEWISEQGLPYGGDKAHFFKDLGTCGLRFSVTRPRVDGERVQAIQGVALLPAE